MRCFGDCAAGAFRASSPGSLMPFPENHQAANGLNGWPPLRKLSFKGGRTTWSGCRLWRSCLHVVTGALRIRPLDAPGSTMPQTASLPVGGATAQADCERNLVDSFIFSVNAIFPIFLTMLLDMFLRHIGLMDRRFADYLNAFVFKVALPVLLFQDLATQDFVAAWDGRYVLFCFVATAASMVAIVLLSHLVVHDVAERGEFIQASCRSSAAILGIAFIQNVYGSSSTSMAALMILGSVPLYNVAAVVVLTLTAPGDGSSGPTVGALVRKALFGVATNPIILGIAAGFAWSLLGLPMPKILASTVGNVAVLATPLGLMALGGGVQVPLCAQEPGRLCRGKHREACGARRGLHAPGYPYGISQPAAHCPACDAGVCLHGELLCYGAQYGTRRDAHLDHRDDDNAGMCPDAHAVALDAACRRLRGIGKHRLCVLFPVP